MLFSHRKGLKSLRELVQSRSVDKETRNLLWSALCEIYWNQVDTEREQFRGSTGRFYNHPENAQYHAFFRAYWLYYLKRSIDEFDDNWMSFFNEMRKYFFTCTWNELFDYLEFVYTHIDIFQRSETLIRSHNQIFEREKVPYRIIKDQITDITSEEEATEVEEALSDGNDAVTTHLATSMAMLFDRQSPDYRNAVKEAISAVEALCRKVTGKDKATLSEALKELVKNAKFHPALLSALDKLYGYTSDESGIRHSLIDMDRIDFADAKFMLVACSSFINYIRTKLA